MKGRSIWLKDSYKRLMRGDKGNREHAQDLLETLLQRRWCGSLSESGFQVKAEDTWRIFFEPGS